jgi:hypothetical protein
MWSRESRLRPALYFFYKGLGIVKGMLYLCIVMMMKLIDSPTQIKRLNKIMMNRVITCGVKSYYFEDLQGYYSLHANKGDNYTTPHLYLKFNITQCLQLKDNMVTMELTPSIEVIVELGVLTLPSYIVLLVGVVIHSLNTSVLRTMNLVGLRLFGPLRNSLIGY